MTPTVQLRRFVSTIVLAIGLSSLPLAAQRFAFRQYGPEQGLDNQVPTAVLQDQTGFIWVGTQNGLYRINLKNSEVEIFRKELDDSHRLGANLVYYLLEAHTPFPEVFDAYARALMALADGETPELPLLRFEFLLLQALGYAVDFEYAADDESAIQPEQLYGFERELGFVACERAPDPRTLFLGAHLLAFAEGRFDTPPLLQAAKRFSRLALQPYLGRRQLKSRELFLKGKASTQ